MIPGEVFACFDSGIGLLECTVKETELSELLIWCDLMICWYLQHLKIHGKTEEKHLAEVFLLVSMYTCFFFCLVVTPPHPLCLFLHRTCLQGPVCLLCLLKAKLAFTAGPNLKLLKFISLSLSFHVYLLYYLRVTGTCNSVAMENTILLLLVA